MLLELNNLFLNTRPSKIQETALPLLLTSPPENMIAQSQSGTGKTAAFVLAMLSRIDLNKGEALSLCLCHVSTALCSVYKSSSVFFMILVSTYTPTSEEPFINRNLNLVYFSHSLQYVVYFVVY